MGRNHVADVAMVSSHQDCFGAHFLIREWGTPTQRYHDMSNSKNKTFCVMMTGPDVQMDQRGDSYEPANALRAMCPHCTFPDLDFVPNPYVLTKGVSSPAETSPAQLGNFLVRERVRRILEVAVPDACAFHPTVERKSKKPAPWWLAVPKHKLTTPVPEATPPFC